MKVAGIEVYVSWNKYYCFIVHCNKISWHEILQEQCLELSFPGANWEAMDFEYIVIRYAMQVICDQIWEKGPWHTFWNVHASKMHISVMVRANLSKLLTVYRGEVPAGITPKWCFKTVLSVSYWAFLIFFSGKCDRKKASDLEHGLARLVLVLYRESLHYHISCRDMIVWKILKTEFFACFSQIRSQIMVDSQWIKFWEWNFWCSGILHLITPALSCFLPWMWWINPFTRSILSVSCDPILPAPNIRFS